MSFPLKSGCQSSLAATDWAFVSKDKKQESKKINKQASVFPDIIIYLSLNESGPSNVNNPFQLNLNMEMFITIINKWFEIKGKVLKQKGKHRPTRYKHIRCVTLHANNLFYGSNQVLLIIIPAGKE
jgi:hypothetical protein